MNDTPTLPSDRQLMDAARQGHDAAWRELMDRHEAPVLSILGARRRWTRRSAIEAVERLRHDHAEDVQGDVGLRAFRPRALAAVTGGRYGPISSETDDADTQDLFLARAFARLPEPWQTVLWHNHVERLSAAEVSPLVGRPASEIGDLVAVAERGLIDAYTLEVLDTGDVDSATAEVIPLLSGYVRDALPPHDQRRVERHLALGDGGPDEGAALAQDIISLARELPEALPPAIAPGVTQVSVAEHRARLGTQNRSFGAATLFANRSDRARRAVVVGSVAAVVLALVGVASLVRQPFDSDDPVSGPSSVVTATTDSDTTLPGDPSTTTPGDAAVPPTTELDLRPDATGPSNTVEVMIDDGNRAIGLQSIDSTISTVASVAAPVFAGGTGTVDLAITNESPDPVQATVELVLPRGVILDDRASGQAECDDPSDDSPFCNISLAGGETLDLSLRLALESAVVGRLRIEGSTLAEAFEAPIVATPQLIHNSVGRGDTVVIGNTVLTCDDAAAAPLGISCDDVRAGTGEVQNRWDVPMTFVGAAPGFGFTNGSTATLDIPTDAEIVHAHLFWSGDLQERTVSVSGDDADSVTIVLPDGEVVGLDAEQMKYGEEDASQYIGRADVTALVTGGGAGDYLVGNIGSAEVQGSYGAWTLVVVFDQDDLPRRHRIVVDPFEWVAPEPQYEYSVDMPAPVVAGAAAHLDVVGFEGELGFVPEQLFVDGVDIGGGNPFDSSIVGAREPAYENNLGVDIDAYDLIIDTPDALLSIDATSDDDGIRIAVLALTVDLEQ